MLRIILPLATSLLLAASYPLINWWALAWIALIPWFFALDQCSFKRAFVISYLIGFIFFFINLYWLFYVTTVGMLLMVAYLSLYFAFFALCYKHFSKRSVTAQIFLLPSCWVVLEYLRATLFSGFGWASLGYSQYLNSVVIQIADITGVYGVSFLIVLINIFFKSAWQHMASGRIKSLLGAPQTFYVVTILVFVFTYGNIKLAKDIKGKDVTIGVVQGNIALAKRRNPLEADRIVERLLMLSYPLTQQGADLIVWSETVFPGMLWQAPHLVERIKVFARSYQTPILFGAVTKEGENYHNTAALISHKGEWIDEYHKVHLVPFGEYIPFRDTFPWLQDFVPIDDFSSGTTMLPLKLSQREDIHIAPLICFEDAVDYVARHFTLAGANVLVNMTNDAWFQNTAAPYLHVQSSVFRAVEHRRPLVRSANTGVSALIDHRGKITNVVQDDHGRQVWVKGSAAHTFTVPSQLTFYTKFGNIFTLLCFSIILINIIRRRFQWNAKL